MKKIITFLTFAIFTSFSLNAAILTVSNNGFVPAQYNTIQDAVDVASSGDTIYVSGSATAYSTFTVRKPLTLIGAGYDANFLSSAYPTTINSIIQLGYDTTNGTDASGTTIIGFYVNSYIYNYVGTYQYGIDDITIRNCTVATAIIQYTSEENPCSNWLIEHNVVNTIGWNDGNNNGDYIENCVVRNNIVYGLIRNMKNGSCVIDHNIFTWASATALNNIQNLVISNNIFHRSNPIASSTTLNMFVNNIFTNDANYDFSQNNNDAIDNISLINIEELMYVNYPTISGHSNDYDYHLQPGSPAIEAANDGTDIGIYGGVSPFPASFGGQPSGIPTVESLEILNPQLGTNCNLQFQSTGEVNP